MVRKVLQKDKQVPVKESTTTKKDPTKSAMEQPPLHNGRTYKEAETPEIESMDIEMETTNSESTNEIESTSTKTGSIQVVESTSTKTESAQVAESSGTKTESTQEVESTSTKSDPTEGAESTSANVKSSSQEVKTVEKEIERTELGSNEHIERTDTKIEITKSGSNEEVTSTETKPEIMDTESNQEVTSTSEMPEEINFKSKRSKKTVEKKIPAVSKVEKPTKRSLKRKTESLGVASKTNEKTEAKATPKVKRQKIFLKVPEISAVPGRVFGIGQNEVGQLGFSSDDVEELKIPTQLELPQSVVDIAAGGMHSVCLTESGEVMTFGCNDEGALGRDTAEEGSECIPRRVDIPERIVQISAGDSHSAALSDSGKVYIWGNFRSGDGPMGLVTVGQTQTTPVRILTSETVVKIASGNDHLVCLSNEGIVYTCGCAQQGQLGRLSEKYTNGGRKGTIVLLTPDKVPLLISSKQAVVNNIWTGSYATFLNIQDSGVIYAFGLNNYNQIDEYSEDSHGNSETTDISSSENPTVIYWPKKATSFSKKTWSQIVGGQHHTLSLDDKGLVYALGRADYGRLGLKDAHDVVSKPTEIESLNNKKCIEISCGDSVSFAVADDGSAFSWGMGSNYQLGHGNDKDKHMPQQIEGEDRDFSESWRAFKIAGGGQHTLILATPK